MILEMAGSMAARQALREHSKNNRLPPESIRPPGPSSSHRAKWEASLYQNRSAPWSEHNGYPFPAYHHPRSDIRPLQPDARPGILSLLVWLVLIRPRCSSVLHRSEPSHLRETGAASWCPCPLVPYRLVTFAPPR